MSGNKKFIKSININQSTEAEFTCLNCRRTIQTVAIGTKHRNHCPVCLWSRHVDNLVGDRRSTCGGDLRPIGLTTKSDGEELMLVHQCQACGQIVKNRIAGDDDDQALLDLVSADHKLELKTQVGLKAAGITLCRDKEFVTECLFGKL